MSNINEDDSFNMRVNPDRDRFIIEAKLIDIIQDCIAEYKSTNSDEDEEENNVKEDNYEEDSAKKGLKASIAVNNHPDLLKVDSLFKLLNSVTYIGMIVRIEKEFNIEFNDEDLGINKIQSLSAFTEYILKRKSEQNNVDGGQR